MSRRRISQREAQKLRKRVNELENAIARERRTYGSQEWFGGVNIATVTLEPSPSACIRTARRLGHAVVVVSDDSLNVRFMALPHPKVSGL